MKLTLVTETKQPLLSRKDLVYTVEYPQASTPSKTELKKAIVTATKAQEGLVILNNVHSSFGKTTAKVEATVYDNEKALNVFSKVDKRKVKKEEKKAEGAAPEAAKPAEEKKEEAPKEEVKAEEKPEEKKE